MTDAVAHASPAWRTYSLNPSLQPDWMSGTAEEEAVKTAEDDLERSFKSKPFFKDRLYVKFARVRDEYDKPTPDGLEAFKRLLRASYLRKVERIDEDIRVLEAQLQDENISETRRSVIPQQVEDARAKLKEADSSLNACCADVDAVIADLRGLSDKIAGIKEHASEKLQQHKRKRTGASLERNLEELSDALRCYEAKREQARLTLTGFRGNYGSCPSQYVLHSSRGPRGKSEINFIVHPVGVTGCDGSCLSVGGLVSIDVHGQFNVPKWQPEWGPEKQFCACKSFQDWDKVDAQDLLYSALRGVEGALKALGGSGDDWEMTELRIHPDSSSS
ncbi:unnamed product [Ostreococcus tauri]|uniref:Unnamed product n=1 Tax=Ostreococcus tauri TaxID=70448 RepID=A0A090MAU6_OSTTA|nr:unnamed product [Ostreococcus tauri]CEF99244.1 unnamed product [Ostreococcus tauri]|eukprot:XP_003081435.2 unnamed product [Ostreococcus tauri]